MQISETSDHHDHCMDFALPPSSLLPLTAHSQGQQMVVYNTQISKANQMNDLIFIHACQGWQKMAVLLLDEIHTKEDPNIAVLLLSCGVLHFVDLAR